MKKLEICQTHEKRALQKCVELLAFLNGNRCWRSRTKKGHSKIAENYCRFWTMLMITRVEERWRGFAFWVWQGLQQDYWPQAMRGNHEEVRKVSFFGSHSNIMKINDSRMLKSLQTCDKNEGRRRKIKNAFLPAENRKVPHKEGFVGRLLLSPVFLWRQHASSHHSLAPSRPKHWTCLVL